MHLEDSDLCDMCLLKEDDLAKNRLLTQNTLTSSFATPHVINNVPECAYEVLCIFCMPTDHVGFHSLMFLCNEALYVLYDVK